MNPQDIDNMHHVITPTKRFPIGCDDFGEIIEQGFSFVDKSLLIRDIIWDSAKVILITRPRRFGKTLNMSLLHYFFAEQVLAYKTAGMFDHLQIAQFPECMAHQGKYPVINLTLKDLQEDSYQNLLYRLGEAVSQMYLAHEALRSSDQLRDEHKRHFDAYIDGLADENMLKLGLRNLIYYLYRGYRVKPIVLIDEYDTPIQAGYQYQYYDKAVQLLRGFLGPALKNNAYLRKAVLTGVLRVAKEGMFSGLNNIRVYSVFNQRYSEYFGFTEREVKELLTQAGLEDKAAEVARWYNGYQISSNRMYNPWSITYYLEEQGKSGCYWLNTSDNLLLKELVINASLSLKAQFQTLLQGNQIKAIITDNFIFPELKEKEETLWALFVMAGYLTPLSEISKEIGHNEYTLDIPNQEIRYIYAQLICEWLAKERSALWYQNVIDQLLTGNIEEFALGMQHIMLQIASVHDLSHEPEAFYQGLMLGLTVYLKNPQYQILSNRESGYGRYDIAIIPQNHKDLGIILELKSLSIEERQALNADIEKLLVIAAQAAVKQIDDREYVTELQRLGFKRVCKIGLAFRGKKLKIEHAITSLP